MWTQIFRMVGRRTYNVDPNCPWRIRAIRGYLVITVAALLMTVAEPSIAIVATSLDISWNHELVIAHQLRVRGVHGHNRGVLGGEHKQKAFVLKFFPMDPLNFDTLIIVVFNRSINFPFFLFWFWFYRFGVLVLFVFISMLVQFKLRWVALFDFDFCRFIDSPLFLSFGFNKKICFACRYY